MPEQDESLSEIVSKLLKAALRRRWWVLIPASVIAVGASVTSLLLPDRYESVATILVERQQVPERYVTANTTIDVRELLLSMTDAILSRTQLLQIINEFGLYPKERQHLVPEQLVDLMRGNIKIQPSIQPLQRGPDPNNLSAFTISFVSGDPHTAQTVATKLTTLFIDENNKSREKQSTETTDFLSEALESAAADLKQQENRVREFRMQALGELPEQQSGNLAILAGYHQELQNTQATLARAHEQQIYLQSMLSQYEALTPAGGPALGSAAANPQDAIKAELAKLRNDRADLLSRYTEKYPDVVKIDEQIKETEALLAVAAQAPAPAKDGAAQGSSPPARPVESNGTIAQLKSQLEANRLEIQNATEDEKQIESKIADYQHRLNLTPLREQQLTDLSRGYDQSKKHYDDMLSKKTQSELATSLERRQQGQRFNIIDPPSLPMKPSSPDHVKISLAGLLAGIAVGAALALLAESKDHSIRDEQDLRGAFSFPLMIGIPMLLSNIELRRRSRFKALEWLAGTALCLLVCAAEFYVYRRS